MIIRFRVYVGICVETAEREEKSCQILYTVERLAFIFTLRV